VDLAYTLGERRTKHSCRGYFLASQPSLKEDLRIENFKEATSSENLVEYALALVFTGQGAQWAQMAKELVEEFSSFRESITQLDTILQHLPHPAPFSVMDVILQPVETSEINQVRKSQPTCTAVQVALVDLLRRWGIQATSVVGHSSGEIAAAYASNFISAAEAITIAYYRGYVIENLTDPYSGAMLATGFTPQEAENKIQSLRLQDNIRVACKNSPQSVTISGDAPAIEQLHSHCQDNGIFARKLATDGRAYHSHHIGRIGHEYDSLLLEGLGSLPKRTKETEPATRHTEWVSSLTGEYIQESVPSSYWRWNAESPVLFHDAVERLVKDKKVHFLEIGPHRALQLPIGQIMEGLGRGMSEYQYSSMIVRKSDSLLSSLNAVAELFVHRQNIDLGRVNRVECPQLNSQSQLPQGQVVPHLPPYPWNYSKLLWSEPRASREFRNRQHMRHELLGSQIPGVNAFHTVWRNLLSLNDLPWIRDHRLGNDSVFPGAAYIAMALEAARQVTVKEVFEFSIRRLRILKGLVLADDERDSRVEVITSIRPHKISSTNISETWFEFEISSVQDDSFTLHALGDVGSNAQHVLPEIDVISHTADSEAQSVQSWYDQLPEIGMNFGPGFQSLERACNARQGDRFYSQASIKPSELHTKDNEYMIDPITIDALFQTAIYSVTGDPSQNVLAKVPLSIESAHFRPLDPNLQLEDRVAFATSEKVGFDSVISSCQLGTGSCFAQIQDVHFGPYEAAKQKQEVSNERHPILRSVWKPCLSQNLRFDPSYVEKALQLRLSKCADDSRLCGNLISVVDLLVHKNPQFQILDLSGKDETAKFSEELLSCLRADTAFKRFSSYERGFISESDELFSRKITAISDLAHGGYELEREDRKFDLVIFPQQGKETRLLSHGLQSVEAFVDVGGIVVGSVPENTRCVLSKAFTSVHIISGNQRIMIGHHSAEHKKASVQKRILLLTGSRSCSFDQVLQKELMQYFNTDVQMIPVDQLDDKVISPSDTVLTTLELQAPVLHELNEKSMARVKCLTENAQNLIWITGSPSRQPEFSLVQGLSRTLRAEQPSLRFFIYCSDFPRCQIGDSVRNLIGVVEETLGCDNPDTEFIENDGLVFINRFVPDEVLNDTFQKVQMEEPTETSLADVSPAQLSIRSVGHFDTFHMKRLPPVVDELGPNYVEIDVKAMGLNAKSVYAAAGKIDIKDGMSAFECAGVITRVGSAVPDLLPGDRVLSMALCQLATVERVPQWSCMKLRDEEDYNSIVTIPTVYATALHGLCEKANLQAGETVLIHSAAGGVGIAAIQIAQMRGAKIFATVGTQEKKDFLVQEFGLDPESIFSSRDLSFVSGILSATENRGVDVVLNSLTGDFLHESWRLCAKFGRFVEVGKQDLSNAGKLDMQVFLRSVSFIAIDLIELYHPENSTSRHSHPLMLRQILDLYRAGTIRTIHPLKVFDISEAAQAFRWFSSNNRIGKVTISFENKESIVKAPPPEYTVSLKSDKSYLLVGCLGGLGRSLTKWLLARGCRRFIFLSRSGVDKGPAASLTQYLEEMGANVQVIRGDVKNLDDVQRCVQAAETPIAGVVHAAMGLDEALWSSMSPNSWLTAIEPKVKGAWNLHHALKEKSHNPDFFLMTSSVSGSLGAATESNYCAANCFLDSFARYRQSLGLSTMSVSLGMVADVGYLHENPEIERMLLRKGLQPINEMELLQIVDLALSDPSCSSMRADRYDPHASSHIITGLEPFALWNMRSKGLDVDVPFMKDPRASLIEAMFERQDPSKKDYPSLKGSGDNTIDEIILQFKTRLSSLILQPLEQIDENQSLPRFGLDSMLASELRTWIYRSFNVDISSLSMMSNSMTLRKLGEKVMESQ
ncbi:hypothetical protein PENSTE_c018G07178, partial [Penicillium steckii]